MAIVKPFRAWRPTPEMAAKFAALPYDVYDRAEAKRAVEKNPESFLAIDRPETGFPDDYDMYAPEVYQHARNLLDEKKSSGILIQDEKPCYYVWEMTWRGRTQTGIVGCASVDDYLNGTIRRHENTRREKEEDRVRHVDVCNAQTGPIFLAYRRNQALEEIIAEVKKQEVLYDFVSEEDGVRNRAFAVRDRRQIEEIQQAFNRIESVYIADGHHRAASAVRVGQERRLRNPGYDGSEPYNYFLSVFFPDDELRILDYNRVVHDLAGMTPQDFLRAAGRAVNIRSVQEEQISPMRRGQFTMFLKNRWYLCEFRDENRSLDPVRGMDVSMLQNLILDPILKIGDPTTDPRIDFVGGIRGLDALEQRCHEDCAVAFAMYPTSIRELFAVADAGRLMPPKSTWFEPKLLSGLFIHEL